MQTNQPNGTHGTGQGPKYTLDIEGQLVPWNEGSITTEQIAQLGGWDPALGVLEIDRDNNERTLQPGEVVELKPGLGFSKKVRWKRGGPLDERLDVEMAILRSRFPDAEIRDRWVRVPGLHIPKGWSAGEIAVATFLRDGFPVVAPYGIYAPAGIRFEGKKPKNYTEPASQRPVFDGEWGVFSWEPATWHAGSDPRNGHNLLNWFLGALERFREGM